MKRVMFPLLAVLLGLFVAVVAAEVWAWSQPPPRIQQVLMLSGKSETAVYEGVPLWRSLDGSAEREDFACDAERRILVLGSSILYGAGLEAEESLGPQLQRSLSGTCVHNLAQPGFTLQNQVAATRRALQGPLAERPPDLVLLEVWANSINELTLIGSRAYNFGELAVDEGGVPSPFGLSSGLNRALFRFSGVYRYVNLTRAQPRQREEASAEWRAFSQTALQEPVAMAAALGARLVAVFMPELGKPFAESLATPVQGYPQAQQALEAAGVDILHAAALLEGEDHEALRMDPCCHYNAEGMAKLAEVLAPHLTE